MVRRVLAVIGLFVLVFAMAVPAEAGSSPGGAPSAAGLVGADPEQPTEAEAEQVPFGRLQADHSQLCVEVPGSSLADDVALVQATCTGAANQQVAAVEVADSGVELRFAHSDKCIQVRDESTVAGARLVQGECNGAPHTLWAASNARRGKELVVNSTGMCMDVFGQERAPGIPITQWPCGNNQSNQAFRGLLYGTAVGGQVTDAGAPSGLIGIDLFSSNAAGERLSFLAKTSTNDGSYTFELDEPGCYVVTFIAPTGRQFTNGLAWLDTPICVEDGERNDTVDAELAAAGELGQIGDNVAYSDGRAAEDVAIDLFTATADGSRGGYLRSTITSGAGGYSFDVDPGCYVVTFIAPSGQTFVDGSRWANAGVCVAAGETNADIDAVLDAGPGQPTLGGTVSRTGGSGEAGVVIDLFTANADGTRGSWLSDVTTDTAGEFNVEVSPGCYVLTFIAPAGETFVNGSRWLNRSVCVEAGESPSDLDAVLA